MEKLRRRQFWVSILYLATALAIFWLTQTYLVPKAEVRAVSYTELLQQVRQGNVEEIELGSTELRARLEQREEDAQPLILVTSRLPNIDETRLLDELDERKVPYTGKIDSPSWWDQLLIGWFLPFFILAIIYWGLMRRVGKASGPLSFGKARVKIYDLSQAGRVSFDDVAGVDEAEAELVEIVSYLKEPQKYQHLGARAPKGVLLVGPPGTGKTLLARAVAGEAAVPFFSLSGSEFVEMFVGVGASRMRDLFEQAKQRAPCIVFIDELDAIGKSRAGVGAFATHDEREQTLNQLLVEMDGFDPGGGVIIMAATNRPEVLDKALLRAGRFDRQVIVDRPDVEGRLAILGVHVRKVKLAKDVDLRTIAQRTPGMVGADLANVVNEAALAAARRAGAEVTTADFEEAVDRIQLGLRKRGVVMNAEEKRRVAFHEAGHALVALSVEHADPVHRVTIIPRTIGALGATLQLPTEERYLMTRTELLDRICVMMGGRAAEEVAFGDVSTGAQNDIERATETARQMVCRFGMTERLGALAFGRPVGLKYLDTPVTFGDERNFSEATAQAIDQEVRDIVEGARERAVSILAARRAVLESIARRLLARETLEREDLVELLGAGVEEQLDGREEREALARVLPGTSRG